MSDKPITYKEGGHVLYRASALGGCLVSLAASRQQLEPKPVPDSFQEIFTAGHLTEEEWVKAYPSAVTSRQMEVLLPITSRIHVIGHVDGLHGERVAEIKSQSDDEYKTWTPGAWSSNPLWVKYGWQISVYMLALDLEAAVIRVRRSNIEDFEIHVIEQPPHTFDEILERVLEVESLATEDSLSCSIPSYPCPYHYLHKEQVEIVDDKALNEALEDYVKAGEDIKYANEIRSLAREVFESVFKEVTVNKIATPKGFTLSRSEYDKKETIIPARHEVRITVTPPKGD